MAVLGTAPSRDLPDGVHFRGERELADRKQQQRHRDANRRADEQTAHPGVRSHLKDTRFWLSGQANFVFQTHPEFPAPYSGPHSLDPHYEKATSRVMTLYTSVRSEERRGGK